MRVLITGAGGYVGSPTLTKLLANPEIEYIVAIDRVEVSPPTIAVDQWISIDLDKVDSAWWSSIVELNNIDTIYYLDTYENSNLAVLTDIQINQYQQSDFFFVEFLQNRVILDNIDIINILYLSTDKVYYDDEFPNELHTLTIQTTVDFSEPSTFPREDRQYFYSYAAAKATTEIKLHAVSNVNLRIIRPFAVTGPGRHKDCPLINQVQLAIDNIDMDLFDEGLQGVAFTHVTDLVNLIVSNSLFDEDVLKTLTSKVINASRVQNYVNVRQLTDKILNKTESSSTIGLASGLNTFSEIMFTPQIRNQVRIEEPQITIEMILDEIIDSLGYSNAYEPLMVQPPVLIVDEIELIGTAEPESVLTFFFGNGEKANIDVDINGNYNYKYKFKYAIDVYPIEVRASSRNYVQYSSAIITEP